MTDPPPAPFEAGSVAAGQGESHPGMPRWVKAAIAVVLVLVVVLMIGKLAGVEHGPGMHGGGEQTPASQNGENGATPSGGQTPPAGAEGHTPPPGLDHGEP